MTWNIKNFRQRKEKKEYKNIQDKTVRDSQFAARYLRYQQLEIP